MSDEIPPMSRYHKMQAFWVFVTLSWGLIGLSSVNWSGIPNLSELITFGLTVTSLVLAALAIVYAYVSNGASNRATVKLEDASDEIKTRARSIVETIANLQSKLESIPELIKGVEGKVSKTHEMFESFSKKATEAGQSITTNPDEDEISENLIKKFIQTSSRAGLKTLLILGASNKHKTPINLEELCKKFQYLDFNYAYGFTVAGTAIGLFDYELEGDVFTVTNFNNTLRNLLKEELERRKKTMSAEELKIFDDEIKEVVTAFKPHTLEDIV